MRLCLCLLLIVLLQCYSLVIVCVAICGFGNLTSVVCFVRLAGGVLFTYCCSVVLFLWFVTVGFGLVLVLVTCFYVGLRNACCVQFRILLVLLSRVLLPGGFGCECECALCDAGWMRWFVVLACLRVFGC